MTPSFAIKILHDRRHGPVRKIDGYSGKVYIFKWEPRLRAYVFHPVSHQQADDIFRTQGRLSSVVFAPCDRIEPAAKAVEAQKPAEEKRAPLDSTLTDTCVLHGIAFTEDDTNETLARLIKTHERAFKLGEESANERWTASLKPTRPKKGAKDSDTAVTPQ